MCTATRFTKLDFTKFFWQFKLSEKSKACTAFRVPGLGTLAYTSLPMGCKCSPAIVQAFMDRIFRVKYRGPGPMNGKLCLGNICLSFSDDFLIFSDDQYHADYVAFCLRILAKHGIGARPDKCEIGADRVAFVGHYMDKDGLHIDPDKTKAVREMPHPTDKAGIRRLLGMAGYLRKFIPNFGLNTVNLTNMLRKEVEFEKVWGAAHAAEVEWLKNSLSSPPVLAFPDWSKQFIVRTDACKYGLGVSLCQVQDGKRRPIAYFSRKTVGPELNYDTRNLECLGVKWGCDKCREWIQGSHFILETDHRNLLYLKQARPEQRRLFNYALALSSLNFTLKHVPGISLADADCLSRNPLQDKSEPDSDDDDFNNPHDPLERLGIPSSTLPQVTASIAAAPDQDKNAYPMQPTADGKYNVFCLGYGVGCDVMATEGTDFRIVGGSENDELAKNHFEKRTGAKDFGTLEELHAKLQQGLDLGPVHVMAGTMPCTERSKLWQLNKNKPPPSTTHLFNLQLEVVKLVKPTVFYAEMTPPCSNSSKAVKERLESDLATLSDYTAFEQALCDAGYDVQSEVFRCSEHGDYTDRQRYICVATRPVPEVSFEMPEPQDTFSGLAQILDPPELVSPALRAASFVPVNSQLHQSRFNAKKIGTVTRGEDGASNCDFLHNRCYDVDHPLPVITGHWSWNGTNGAQWVLDEIGPRQLTITEQARVHNFDSEATSFLMNTDKRSAQGYIARSVPVGFLTKLYKSAHKFLQSATAVDNSPLLNVVRTNALKVTVAFPDLPSIIEAQHADKELAAVIKYLETKDPELMPTSSWQRHVKYMHMHKGALFVRTELGDGEVLTDALAIPESLRHVVMEAIHTSVYYGHPGVKAMLQLVREQAFWPRMVKHIKKYIANCAECRKAKAGRRTHAGQTNRDRYVQHGESYSIDMIGPFCAVDGLKWVMHVTDDATGWNYVDTLPNKKGSTVAASLHKNVILKHGQPKRLRSDNGTEFVNQIMTALLKDYGVKHVRSSPYHPRGNAFVETRHRHYNAILKICCNKMGMSWPVAVHYANWCLNIRPYGETGISPYELLFAKKPPTLVELAIGDTDFEYKEQLSDEEFLKQARLHHANISAMVQQAKESKMLENDHQDQPRYSVTHEKGDLVLIKAPVYKKGKTSRLLYQSVGPFEVIGPASSPNKDGSFNVYRLRHLTSDKIVTYNVELIVPYISRRMHYELQENAEAERVDQGISTLSNPTFDPQPNDFLLLPDFGGVPYHLVQVQSVEDDGDVNFLYLNTSDKERKVRFRWVYTHESDLEIQAMTCNRKGYIKEVHTAPSGVFCQHPVAVEKKPGSIGYSLKAKDIKEVLSYKSVEAY